MQQSFTATIRRTVYQTLASLDSIVGSSTPMVTILCYHGIDTSGWYHSVTLEQFEKQLRALSKKYTFVSLSQVVQHITGTKKITEPSICITFDDGYKNIMKAQKVLRKYKVTPTVFVLTDTEHVDRAELENEMPLLSKKEIQTLQKNGWEIGCHTATHANLKALNSRELKREIKDAKKAVEAITGCQCNYIAYPKGKYSVEALQMVLASKFTLGLTMDDGFISSRTNVLQVPRIGINASHSVSELLASLSPLNTLFRKSIKTIIN